MSFHLFIQESAKQPNLFVGENPEQLLTARRVGQHLASSPGISLFVISFDTVERNPPLTRGARSENRSTPGRASAGMPVAERCTRSGSFLMAWCIESKERPSQCERCSRSNVGVCSARKKTALSVRLRSCTRLSFRSEGSVANSKTARSPRLLQTADVNTYHERPRRSQEA